MIFPAQRHDHRTMNEVDVTCPECGAGFLRIELSSQHGLPGEYRCPVCDTLLETFDGSTEIAYRLTIVPEGRDD